MKKKCLQCNIALKNRMIISVNCLNSSEKPLERSHQNFGEITKTEVVLKRFCFAKSLVFSSMKDTLEHCSSLNSYKNKIHFQLAARYPTPRGLRCLFTGFRNLRGCNFQEIENFSNFLFETSGTSGHSIGIEGGFGVFGAFASDTLSRVLSPQNHFYIAYLKLQSL